MSEVTVNARPTLLTQLRRCQRRLGDVAAGWVVAVSGGPDSVALARALAAMPAKRPLGPLTIAHLNHQLRGEESDADAAFVCRLHEELATGSRHLHLRCESIPVADQLRTARGNLEATARRIRYDWLARVAREVGAHFVATGHTADDQAETVLHHLIRGSGLKGLRGIAWRRPLTPEVELVRPFLRVTRAEVLAYLQAQGQAYRHDSSNADLRFTRNRIRHELLPQLAERYNPAIASILRRLARQASDLYRSQETAGRALLAAAERPRAGSLLIFDRQRLADAPRVEVREMFRLAWAREGWPLGEMSYHAWQRLAAVARGAKQAVDLPGGIHARQRERVVQVGQVQ
jgi:tRNA(Ile)-lysidine synthase